MSTYKVGDRVRTMNRYFSPEDIGTIVRIQPSHHAYPYYVRFDNGSGSELDLFSADELIPVVDKSDADSVLRKIIAIVNDPHSTALLDYEMIVDLLEDENLL